MSAAPTPPGWYDDGLGSVRWWDGSVWTDQTYRGQLAVGAEPATGLTAASGGSLTYAVAVLPGTSEVTTHVAYHSLRHAPREPSGDGVLSLILGLVVLGASAFTLLNYGGLSILAALVGVGLLVRAAAEFRGAEPPMGLAGSVLPREGTRLTLVVVVLLLITCGLPVLAAGALTPPRPTVVPVTPTAPATTTVAKQTWPAGYTEAPPEGAYKLLAEDSSACDPGTRCRAVSVVMSHACASAFVRVEYFANPASGVPVDDTIYRLTRVKKLKATRLLVSTTRDLDYFRVTAVGCA